jgi:prepilin-type N-terminal cleavage/methylation domain-containing protein
MKMKNRFATKGFTLIELLIAIAILTSTFVVIASSLKISRIAQQSAHQALAYSIASSLLEATQGLPFTDLDNRTTSTPLGIFPPHGMWEVQADSNALSASNTLALTGTSTAISGISGALRIPTNAFGDFTAEAALKIPTTAPSGWRASIVFRAKDFEHFYRYSLQNDKLLLERVQGATTTELWSQPASLATSTWYRPKVVASGSNFTLFMNDTQYASVSDATYATGVLAIASGGGTLLSVDNVTVSSPTSLSWNFDTTNPSALPAGWRRPWIQDLPKGTVALTIADWSGLAGIKKITAEVTWGGESGIKRVELTTLRSKY